MIVAAFDYLKRYPLEVDVAMFESNCGVGIVVTAEDIKNEVSVTVYIGYLSVLFLCVLFQVTRVIDEHRAEIIDKGYQFNISTLMSE